MKDGNYQHPNRFRLQKVAGTDDVYDFTFAPGEVYQEGDYFNKANLFPDTLIPKLWPLGGAPANPQVKDGLDLLSRFEGGLGNEWVWAKGKYGNKYDTTKFFSAPVSEVGVLIAYSDSFRVEKSKFILENKLMITVNSGNVSSPSLYQALKGKYTYVTNNLTVEAVDTLYFYPTYTVFSWQGSFMQASEKWELKNPNISFTIEKYLNSPNPAAYTPVPSDGFEYIKLGQLGGATRTAMVEYVGTGTYGEANAISVTFPFPPDFLTVMVSGEGDEFPNYSYGFLYGLTKYLTTSYKSHLPFGLVSSGGSAGKKSSDGKTISWYGKSSASPGLNSQNWKYHIIGFMF